MRAFDFVITLYSFVYALAVAQILSTVGDMIRAGKRLSFSWINAGWMLNVLLAIVAWWLSLWDLRTEQRWGMAIVLVFFTVACLLYVLARMVSAPIPAEGPVDLQLYHREEGVNMRELLRWNAQSPSGPFSYTVRQARTGLLRTGRRDRR